jgi:hypothetical protein
MQKKTSPPRVKIAQAKLLQAKLLYDAGAPIAEITTLIGMTDARFRAFREANGWPLRASACPRKSAPAETPAEPRRPADPGRLIARLEDAVEREFARAEAALEKHAPKTIEASARTLATLVKTLAELIRMRREPDDAREETTRPDDDARATDEPPRELAELRAELARRLERLRGGGEAE